MSKFASSSVLLLSLAMLAAGAIVPQIAILSFLGGIANIISIAGAVLLAIFLIASFGLKGILYLILYVFIFYVVQWIVSFVFGLLGLGGMVFNVIGLVLAIFGTIFVANRIA
ncbi:MAG: hypothetical protein J6V80_02465 [Clostridia bacterium]|nr:hypothetical protein [Clostridia bacterium]